MSTLQKSEGTTSEVKIGLWGATGGGKTLLLAAMYATMFHGPEQGDAWHIVAPQDSLSFLDAAYDILARRMLPPATTLASLYEFLVTGTELVPQGGSFLTAPRMVERPISFKLVVQDAPGGDFRGPRAQQSSEYLATCQGIVLVFDPIREFEAVDDTERNLAFIRPVLTRLQSRLSSEMERTGGVLPHLVAVCITKYDDPRVFERLMRRDQIAIVDDVARVPNARAAIETLQGAGIRDLLERSFRQVEYLAVSSIGFAPPPFDRIFYSNVVETAAGPRLKGGVAPVGVLEPFKWLERSLRAGR